MSTATDSRSGARPLRRRELAAAAPARTRLTTQLILAVALFVLAILPYLPALRGDFIWDDDAHVTANPTVIGPLGWREIWTTPAANYFPLVLSLFRVIYAGCGLNPLAYHAVTLAFHALAVIALWRTLEALIAARGTIAPAASPTVTAAVPGWRPTAAWLGAAWWAVHPVQTESVAWISELKNTVSAVFFFAAIRCWLAWLRPDPSGAPTGPKRWRAYAAVFVCSVLALLSKPSTVMLPAALLLCAWWVGSAGLSRGSHFRRAWRTTAAVLPIAALALVAGLWAIWEQKHHQNAVGAAWDQTLGERVALAGHAVWFYLGKLAWPHPLIFVYPRSVPSGAATIGCWAALAAGFALLWRNRRRPAWRASLFGAAYFVALLFPVLGFFTVYYFRYSFVADHFQYLASVAPLVLAAAGLLELLGRLPPSTAWLRNAVLAATLGGFAALSWHQAGMYRNSVVLYDRLLADNPGCWLAHNNLARIQIERGELDDAIAHCRTSLRLHPTAVAHFNLGLALMEKGSANDALSEYHAALALDPTMTEAYCNLGVLLASDGHTDAAAEVYRRAAKVDPTSATVQDHWGLLLAAGADFGGAVEHYRAALALDPRSAETYDHLGVALVQLHRFEKALAAFAAAVRIAPTFFSAQHHVGQVLALQGNPAAAVAAYRTAIELRPTAPEAHLHLATALQQLGQTEAAADELRTAVQLDPALAEARQRLEALDAAARERTTAP